MCCINPPSPGDAVDRSSVECTKISFPKGDGQSGVPTAADQLHPGDLIDQHGASSPRQLLSILSVTWEAEGQLPGTYPRFFYPVP